MKNDLVINTIIIDDDIDYATELAGAAAEYNISLLHYANLQSALEEIADNASVDFIILDALCLVDEEDTAVDFDFVGNALLGLNEINTKRDKPIPFCLNTGFADNKKVTRHIGKLDVFEKVTDQSRLFQYIVDRITKSDEYLARQQHTEIFELFKKGYLDKEVESMLVSVLCAEFDPISVSLIKEQATQIRAIQEAIYKSLNRLSSNILPDKFFRTGNGMLDFNAAKKWLSGRRPADDGKEFTDKEFDYQGSDLDNLSTSIYWITGNLIHYSPDRVYQNSRYTLEALKFALLEQLLWFRQLVQNIAST
ncbi:hypothetical protein SAMN05444008_101377 [Cnuella takakiae]|uniref:Uncharacterized protein n=1 Tax=Cnuella takakiae TaxID=1302690 RepID=A0A1M4TBS0_9BACT|nr:hypothetical protein [Cnuella takakiae]OLY90706.1 hypothetical protein BUE76_01440 [Cnuella takakiae]SHE41962.1 hypothetical protein SAMN05444008_101377 [Cnuella takakiae]